MEQKLEKRWGTFNDLRNGFSVPRSTAHIRLKTGDFKSRYMGNRRLIDLDSVREFFANAPSKPCNKKVRQMRKAARASVKARKAIAAAKNGENQHT